MITLYLDLVLSSVSDVDVLSLALASAVASIPSAAGTDDLAPRYM